MLEDYVKVFSALLTPVLAIVAVYIAWQQWRTSHLKLKHDLYERRLVVYLAVMDFLACIMRNTKATDAEMINFLQKTRESYFLFSPELADYLNEIHNRSVDLQYQSTMLNDPMSSLPVGEKRTQIAHEKSETLKWCTAQFEIARQKFGTYMRLS
jgi:hypothetical protein